MLSVKRNQGGRINTPTQTNWTTYTLPLAYKQFFTPVASMGVTGGLAEAYASGTTALSYKALATGSSWTNTEPLFFITVGK